MLQRSSWKTKERRRERQIAQKICWRYDLGISHNSVMGRHKMPGHNSCRRTKLASYCFCFLVCFVVLGIVTQNAVVSTYLSKAGE